MPIQRIKVLKIISYDREHPTGTRILSNNFLSIYILQHEQNETFEQNLCLIQEAMRSDKPAGSKFKRVSK